MKTTMQLFFVYLYKCSKFGITKIRKPIDWLSTYILLFCNSAKFASFKSFGVPKINVSLGGGLEIGANFTMNNLESSNPIGRFNACSIIVGSKGYLRIGENVGMSSSGIVCHDSIILGNNVMLGGNVIIYDTDFHSLKASDRADAARDKENVKTRPVVIGDNVFVGSHTTILKGVKIGANAVVGACSLITRNIPEGEIWAGNPAAKIKDSNYSKN